MPHYEDSFLAFDAPDTWVDRSLVSFGPPTASGRLGPNMVMARAPMGAGDILAVHTRTLVDASRRLPGFELLATDERTVGGRRALVLRFAYGPPHARIAQTMVHVAPAANDPESRLTLLVFTTSGDGAFADDFDAILGTVRFSDAPRTAQRTSAPPPPTPRPAPPAARLDDPHPTMPAIPMPGMRQRSA